MLDICFSVSSIILPSTLVKPNEVSISLVFPNLFCVYVCWFFLIPRWPVLIAFVPSEKCLLLSGACLDGGKHILLPHSDCHPTILMKNSLSHHIERLSRSHPACFCSGVVPLSVRWVHHFDREPVGMRVGQLLWQLWGCCAWTSSLWPSGQMLCAKAVTCSLQTAFIPVSPGGTASF